MKFGGPTSIQTLGSRRLSREFGDIIDSVNATRAETMAIDKSWDVPANPMNRFCRSDQVNYVHHDVPVTYFSLGYAEDYHQPTDEPQYIDYDHAARLGRFIHDVMWAIAKRKDQTGDRGTGSVVSGLPLGRDSRRPASVYNEFNCGGPKLGRQERMNYLDTDDTNVNGSNRGPNGDIAPERHRLDSFSFVASVYNGFNLRRPRGSGKNELLGHG